MYKLKVSEGKFEGEELSGCKWIKGSNFQVLVFDNYVVKIPIENNEISGIINKPNTRTLKEVNDLQNELHEKFPDCTVPSYYYVDFIVSPRPKGTTYIEECDRPKMMDRVKKIHTEMNMAGYELGDIHDISNYFYDKETDKIVIIDYSHLQIIK